MAEKLANVKKIKHIKPMTVSITAYQSHDIYGYRGNVTLPVLDGYTKIKLLSAEFGAVAVGVQATFYSDEESTQQIEYVYWNPNKEIGVSKDIPDGTKSVRLYTIQESNRARQTASATFQFHN